ncbi:MAG: fused response regulator/phosphatase [Magnetospirillum gryphiswaldense]|nr:fused response regulator/phosphatase [Magnetospirillum gryphiswaldense]
MPDTGETIKGLVKLTPRPLWGKAPEVGAVAKSTVSGADRGVKKLRVLLVEDQPGDAMLVMIALRESTATHFQVTHVPTLAGAKDALASQDMDVVLLDLSLPDSSGLDTVTKLLAVAPRMPVVVMTGLDDPMLASRALEVGAQDYLVKSDDPGRAVERAILYAITRMNSQIEREQLSEQLAKEQSRVLEEIAVARTMQFDLLPRPDRLNPVLDQLGLALHSYFEPCSGIGGDLWGCHDLGDGRLSVTAFDFSGHGIGAALNVFRLHTLIDEQRQHLADPATLLHNLGGSLRQLLGRGQFATMFAAVIDCRAQEIIWSGAGSPAPLLFRGGRAEFMDSRGIPLGLMPNPQYHTHRTAFPRGSELLIYSDALIEATGNDQTMLGNEGLLDLIGQSRDEDGLAIENLLDHFYNWARPPLEDDLTVIHLQWPFG